MSSEERSPIERLEELVGEASVQLGALRQENRQLRERLQEQVGERSTVGVRQEGWQEDRKELLERVEQLVGGLDELLQIADG